MAKENKKPNRKYVPNRRRAIITGHIATIYNGRRIIRFYISGEPLKGRIEHE